MVRSQRGPGGWAGPRVAPGRVGLLQARRPCRAEPPRRTETAPLRQFKDSMSKLKLDSGTVVTMLLTATGEVEVAISLPGASTDLSKARRYRSGVPCRGRLRGGVAAVEWACQGLHGPMGLSDRPAPGGLSGRGHQP